MTTIITRLFSDQAAARRAADRLIFRGLPRSACTVVSGADAEAKLGHLRVHETAIAPYSKALASGNAALVVKATYKPLGVVQLTRDILAKYESIDVPGATEEQKLPWEPERAPSVLKDHPLLLTLPGVEVPHGPITGNFGMRMTKPHRDHRPLSDKRASRAFWPTKLISNKPRRSKVISGGKQMSKMFWPMPLLSDKARRKSVIPGGGLFFSRLFGVRPLS